MIESRWKLAPDGWMVARRDMMEMEASDGSLIQGPAGRITIEIPLTDGTTVVIHDPRDVTVRPR